MTSIRNVFWAITKPFVKMALQDPVPMDPWERMRFPFPNRYLSPQIVTGFRIYFAGASSLSIKTLNELCEWLLGCRYVDRQDVFENPELWQHPLQFERRRDGDCLCHALWAWRKLLELGYRAELLVGEMKRTDGTWG